jgi:ABC-2 type transport system permease protein
MARITMKEKGNKPGFIRATFAIAKASLRSMLRSPSAVVFTLAFPLIFIIVFGFIGNGGIKVDVGLKPGCDTTNQIYFAIQQVPMLRLINEKDQASLDNDLQKGKIDAVIDIQKNAAAAPAFIVDLQTTEASPEKGNIFRSVLTNILSQANQLALNEPPRIAVLRESKVSGRQYKSIDFILPGQLGFSLLSTGVFGTAFVFISLRITLVIKRFFATPINRASIVLGEAFSRLIFALVGALFIILVGHYFFGYTLINGFVTVVDMLILSTLGLIVFMGFGFTVSGIAKNESSVPPIANIITLPQFLLSGTFFSVEAFPTWLQPISKALPLTYLNDALRKVAFEGATLVDVLPQIGILLLWAVIIYSVAVKVFKWE